jgi:exo-beta-1,3-glucanase (GH17 family)
VKQRLILLATLSIAVGFCLWYWWRDGHSVALADAPSGKLDCVSYSPSGKEPLEQTGVGRAQLHRDLSLLAQRFKCVRIYSVSNGLDQVPVVARELGLRVLLGMWIGRENLHNQREIKLGLAIAERDRDVIDGIIVGNEVLLRKELDPEQLGALLRQVNEATTLPVTYADVWDFWLEAPQLAQDVDFVTIHLLPYWENHPTGIDAALAHTANVYGVATGTFPGKRVFIGETGWPSRGRQRVDAAPGRVNQARFVREFTAWAESNGIQYNLIEAFDQPWKRAQEGTVGGYWGMYDTAGQPKFPLHGPMQEDPQWQRGAWAAAASAALFGLLGLLLRRGAHWTSPLIMLLGGAAAGSVAALQWRYLVASNRTTTEWVVSGLVVAIGWALYVQLLHGLARGKPLPPLAGTAEALGRLGQPGAADTGRARLPGVLRFLLLLNLAYTCLALTFDSRYRDFPSNLYALPVLALCLTALLHRSRAAPRYREIAEETLLAGCAAVCPVAIAILEGPQNLSALGFCVLCLAAAWSVFHPSSHLARQDKQGQHHTDHG